MPIEKSPSRKVKVVFLKKDSNSQGTLYGRGDGIEYIKLAFAVRHEAHTN